MFGPFNTAEACQKEVELSGCGIAHFAMKGEPPLSVSIQVGEPCVGAEIDVLTAGFYWREWYYENRYTQEAA